MAGPVKLVVPDETKIAGMLVTFNYAGVEELSRSLVLRVGVAHSIARCWTVKTAPAGLLLEYPLV